MNDRPWRIRGPQPDDLPYLVQTYVRSGKGSMWAQEVDGIDWAPLAERFVAHCATTGACVVACGQRDPQAILGYALGQRRADRAEVHWLYTKGLYRRHGVASSLLEHLTSKAPRVVVTHTTASWQRREVQRRGWQVALRLPWLRLLTEEAAA